MDLEMNAPPRPATELDAAAPRAGGSPSQALGVAKTCFTGCCKITGYMIGPLAICCLLAWMIWLHVTYKDPTYSVEITDASGLDRRPAMEPAFNLTVRIAFRSSFGRVCDKLGTTVQVSYHGFPLAFGAAPQVCELAYGHAKKGRTVRSTVVARGTRLWLPGPAMDSLAADVESSAGVFDVVLTIPDTSLPKREDNGLIVSCEGRRVREDGGGAALCEVRIQPRPRT